MHELSIVMSIIDIANQQLVASGAENIEEIELVIGKLSGIEDASFDFAWNQAIKNTALEKANRIINKIDGIATCMDCDIDFPIQQIYDACPACGGHLISIKQGKELKVKSLVVN
jgi:hydrogenase nickel incorporation protein HypA/HybF